MIERRFRNVEIGGATDPGQKRAESKNQDAIGLIEPNVWLRRPVGLIVSDGMGGYDGGEIASRTAVETFSEALRLGLLTRSAESAIQDGIAAVHCAIRQISEQDSDHGWMGCTIVVALILGEKVVVANVGDSRAYLVTDDQIIQISRDHSLVAEQVRLGLITEEEAKTHLKRSVLTMAISLRQENVDPFIAETGWERGDRILLCSDGLWSVLSAEEIRDIIKRFPPRQAAEELIRRVNESGGPDNVSVMIGQHL